MELINRLPAEVTLYMKDTLKMKNRNGILVNQLNTQDFEELFKQRSVPYSDDYGLLTIHVKIKDTQKLLVVYINDDDDGWYYIDRQKQFHYYFPN
jgi:hypothetical protein